MSRSKLTFRFAEKLVFEFARVLQEKLKLHTPAIPSWTLPFEALLRNQDS